MIRRHSPRLTERGEWTVADDERWRANLEEERRQKDAFFAEAPESPIPPGKRGSFAGLSYFPPHAGYRLEVRLQEHKDKQVVTFASTNGKEQEFLRWGEFRFTIGGTEYTLQAYKTVPFEKPLFVLFKDATSGRETYGAGRYLDLEPGRDRTPDGTWVLDFNRAYNPWCAYSESYACPLVPRENWLDVAIRAGEKYPYRTPEE